MISNESGNVDDGMREMTLLGYAVFTAHKIEFALYGIISHLSHHPAAQKDKRLRELSGEKFLRGDASELKVTFGQLVNIFGDAVLIASSDLDKFIADRNLITHNYFRHFRTTFASTANRDAAAVEFLSDFLIRGQQFLQVVEGLLLVVLGAFAEKAGRVDELAYTAEGVAKRQAYIDYVARHRVASNESTEM